MESRAGGVQGAISKKRHPALARQDSVYRYRHLWLCRTGLDHAVLLLSSIPGSLVLDVHGKGAYINIYQC